MAINLNLIASNKERDMLIAFNEAIQDIKGSAKVSDLEKLINAGDVDGVIRLLGLDPEAFQGMEDELLQSYRTGGLTGAAQIGLIPSEVGDIRFRFNMRAPDAEKWIANESSRMVTELVDSQREIVREVMVEGLANGDNPRRTALDLVGVVQPNGKRSGGYIGLTTQQHKWITNARTELETLNPHYFTRQLRDKRFDSAIRRAMANGEPLTSTQINNAIRQMQNKALKFRGDMIARTETITALRAGQYESVIQAIRKGEADIEDVSKIWDATDNTIGGRTRDTHVMMEGQKRDIEIPFDFPTGGQAQFAGDSSLGAPASETINCRCKSIYKIDFLGKLKRVEGFK